MTDDIAPRVRARAFGFLAEQVALRGEVRSGVYPLLRASMRNLAFAAGLVSGLAMVGGCFSDDPPRKNVVLITLDALRQDHISAFGYGRRTTPSIDRLAAAGAAFRDIVPTGCSTLMSLTSLLTSRPYSTAQTEAATVLREENVTLAEVFRRAGYRTAGFVASPVLVAETGFGQGFDSYEDFKREEGTYVTADLPVRGAIEYLRAEDEDAPFFLYLHLEEPHPPWVHASPWLEGEETAERFFGAGCTYIPTAAELAALESGERRNLIAKYDGAIRYADEQIGLLVEELHQRDLLSSTVIAVTTDHGIELAERYSATHGHNPFDEVVRGFLILFDGGSRIMAPAERTQGRIFDVGPTLMALAGVDKPPTAVGVDLLQASEAVPPYAFTRCYNADVVRSLEHKLILVDFDLARRKGDNLPVGLREGLHLFDLRDDPGEKRDVQSSRPAQVRAMRRILHQSRAVLTLELPPVPHKDAPSLDPKTRERLRALGYE